MDNETQSNAGHFILFYDGECGFCNKSVQFVLRHDRRDRFLFATLQGPFANQILPKHQKDPRDLNTMYLLINQGEPTESVLAKSSAVARVLKELGGAWKVFGLLMGALPRSIRDWGYDVVARNRYRIAGKGDACPIPSPKDRTKFLHE